MGISSQFETENYTQRLYIVQKLCNYFLGPNCIYTSSIYTTHFLIVSCLRSFFHFIVMTESLNQVPFCFFRIIVFTTLGNFLWLAKIFVYSVLVLSLILN